MNTNKVTIIGTIVIIFLIIFLPTTYKVIKTHHDNLYRVVEEKIIENAKKCYYEDKCLEDKITLDTLYQNGYLDACVDPVTKEYYNKESYVLVKDNDFTFVRVN